MSTGINSTRLVKVIDLIVRLQKNKAAHIKDYNEAVIAFKEKAITELNKSLTEINEGSLELSISLTTPVNKSEYYDKLIEMFKWEQRIEIEISKAEFDQYIHDEESSIVIAKMRNSSYK